ncbi:MAG: pirin family protein, partial [Hyphomicrobiales bacterium]
MTWHPAKDPIPGDKKSCEAIETIIVPRARDLGGFEVRRALPSARKQMIGPFIFFDQMGPAEFLTNQGIDVRPHPHIGLSTVTYLFSGEIYHRDSLGSELPIAPGAVNWMTAGKGIVHSERTSDDKRQNGQNLFGIQTWVAMPRKFEEIDPQFEHQTASSLPVLEENGVTTRIIIGDMYGQKSPVKTYSDMFYASAELQAG